MTKEVWSNHSKDGLMTDFGEFEHTNGYWWIGRLRKCIGDISETPGLKTIRRGNPSQCSIVAVDEEVFYKYLLGRAMERL